jgi:hypothetical protein
MTGSSCDVQSDPSVEAHEVLGHSKESNRDPEESGPGSSKVVALLTPKLEGCEKKRSKLEVIESVKKVKGHPVGSTELSTPISPSATLSFQPETSITFKPYGAIKSPFTDGPAPHCAIKKLKKRLPL